MHKPSGYNGSGQRNSEQWECTFCVLSLLSARWNLYQIDFRMEAKGVTPIPAPTSTATSYWKTSSLTVPKGPSTSILANEKRQWTHTDSALSLSPNVVSETLTDLHFRKELFSLFGYSTSRFESLKVSRTYLGIGECCRSNVLMRFSVQSPAARI